MLVRLSPGSLSATLSEPGHEAFSLAQPCDACSAP